MTATEGEGERDGEGRPSTLVRRLLLLCTGNYYRSRFAEELWNHFERLEPSRWRAESRGLWVPAGFANIGPISPHALRALRTRGVQLVEPVRPPRQVEPEDFAAAAHIVAMCESEHRSMVENRFPQWAQKVEYWDIEDIDQCAVEAAMAALSTRMGTLRTKLVAGCASFADGD
jgi:protein-tyrosine phosphatase